MICKMCGDVIVIEPGYLPPESGMCWSCAEDCIVPLLYAVEMAKELQKALLDKDVGFCANKAEKLRRLAGANIEFSQALADLPEALMEEEYVEPEEEGKEHPPIPVP